MTEATDQRDPAPTPGGCDDCEALWSFGCAYGPMLRVLHEHGCPFWVQHGVREGDPCTST